MWMQQNGRSWSKAARQQGDLEWSGCSCWTGKSSFCIIRFVVWHRTDIFKPSLWSVALWFFWGHSLLIFVVALAAEVEFQYLVGWVIRIAVGCVLQLLLTNSSRHFDSSWQSLTAFNGVACRKSVLVYSSLIEHAFGIISSGDRAADEAQDGFVLAFGSSRHCSWQWIFSHDNGFFVAQVRSICKYRRQRLDKFGNRLLQ